MAERVIPAAPFTSSTRGVLISPFQFTTTGEDHLRVVSANSAAGVRLRIQGRYFDEKGQLKPLSEQQTPNTDRSVKTTDYALAPGALTNLTVFAEAGAPLVGQTYVMLQLIRGLTGATIVLGTLLAGYVTARQPLGWPGSPIQDSLAGGGALRTVLGTNPAAGAEISETVPTGARWELKAFGAGFTTDVTVTARRPSLVFSDGVANYGRIPSALNQDASESFGHSWTQGVSLPLFVGVGYGYGPLPTTRSLRAGWSITTLTENLQAGDNWDAPRYLVEEWLEVNT